MRDQPWAALFVPPELDVETVDDCTELLTRANERFLRSHPETPWLYQTGAHYELQPEFWLTIPWALAAARTGRGLDCKVLCAWRTAELRVRHGEPARCFATPHKDLKGKTVYHVRVLRMGGWAIEDPSAELGMYQALAHGPQESRPWNLLPSPY